MSRNKIIGLGLLMCSSILTGCIAKDVAFTEQQKRMQRCDKYLDRERDKCLQGEHVRIEDYQDDYKAFKKSERKAAEQKQTKLPKVIVPKPTIIDANTTSTTPEDKT